MGYSLSSSKTILTSTCHWSQPVLFFHRIRTGDSQSESQLYLLTVIFDEKLFHQPETPIHPSVTSHKWHQCAKNIDDVIDYEHTCSEFTLHTECQQTCALGAQNGLCQWVPENR